MSFQFELRRVIEGHEHFSLEEARLLMRRILAGEASDIEIGALLGALAARGETAEEVAGFALALREQAVTLPLTEDERSRIVDTCGTGGDTSGTFNISTASALVAAAAGASVAKHGNRAVTSKSGSADVLEALGIPTDLAPDAAAEALRRHGFVFLHAPSHHPGMKAVMPVRRAIGIRTVFNVLGPLLNPAGARRQVMGVYAERLVPLAAQAMTHLGTTHALVVHGEGGLDELSLAGTSAVAEVRTGQPVALRSVEPEDAKLQRAPLGELVTTNVEDSAAVLRGIFAGERGPRRDVVLLNAAAVLQVAGLADTLAQGVEKAAAAIDAGRVQQLVVSLQRS
ncbi:anthranilate phosphoribosyltransferase [Granulicella cerasi]|uniref:anthranilate phosphoribosyltransferase n=1 Tax=Granulicella cerasi TaxID=741063 RepID=UPI0021DFB76A|nr:anthranilate phosphoribosyltransferase [Granulicella cerasi]